MGPLLPLRHPGRRRGHPARRGLPAAGGNAAAGRSAAQGGGLPPAARAHGARTPDRTPPGRLSTGGTASPSPRPATPASCPTARSWTPSSAPCAAPGCRSATPRASTPTSGCRWVRRWRWATRDWPSSSTSTARRRCGSAPHRRDLRLLPDGMDILDARDLVPGAPSLGKMVAAARYRIAASNHESWPEAPTALPEDASHRSQRLGIAA